MSTTPPATTDRRLEAGEVVTRLLSQEGGTGVEASAIIDATPEAVYGVVTDYDHYPEFIPSLVDAKVLEWESDDVCVLMEKLKVAFKTIEYAIRITHDRRKLSTRWTKHDGFLRRNDGGWTCKPHGKGRTLVTYRVAVEAGLLVPQFVIDRLSRGSLPDLFAGLRKRVEELRSDGSGERRGKAAGRRH